MTTTTIGNIRVAYDGTDLVLVQNGKTIVMTRQQAEQIASVLGGQNASQKS